MAGPSSSLVAACSACGARYTLHDWYLLAFVSRLPGFAGDGAAELRRCRCGATLHVDVGAVRQLEIDMTAVQSGAERALRDAWLVNDDVAERRCFVVLALLDRAQGFDHRRRDFLRELHNVRDYVRRRARMAAWTTPMVVVHPSAQAAAP